MNAPYASRLIHGLISLGIFATFSLSIVESSNAESFQAALLDQQAVKESHRKKYPYSEYFKLTLRRDTNKKPNGIFVFPGENSSLFSKAGFRQGDVVLAVDGDPAVSELVAVHLAEKLYAGNLIKLKIENSGERRELTIDLSEFEL